MCDSIFSAKNIPFKNLHFKSFKSRAWPNHVSKIKPSKIFRSKLPKARINEGIRPPIFGHLFVHQKCPFGPLCVGVLKHEMQNIQKCGCDHNAHKTYFWRKKRVTDIFWGMAAESNADI